MNKLERFKRLSVQDEWPTCFLCDEPVQTGYTLWDNESGPVTVCDNCLALARKSDTGWVTE